MEPTLFDEPKFRVELYHMAQKRVILEPSKEFTQEDVEKANKYFVDCLCPNLVYRRKSETE